MSSIKRQIKFFDVMQYENEAIYLSTMHARGWKLKKIAFPGIYTFESCTPEQVVYQLDYNREGMNNHDEYLQLFADCGWTYLFDFVGYSYFYKPAAEMNGPEEIFCDDASRLEMMKRVFRGRITPLIILFFLVIIPQLFMNFSRGNAPFLLFFEIMLVLYTAIFVKFAIQYYQFRQKLK